MRRTPPAPPPANVASAPALGAASDSRLSGISANAEAASFANSKQPVGPITAAVAGPLSVIQKLSGPATDADRAAALALVNQALGGKVAESEAGWVKARSDAEALSAQVSSLEKQVAAERISAAAELQRQLSAARDEEHAKAAAEQRRLIGWIFYGGGALLLVLGGVAFSLIASVPMIGPNVCRALLGSGALLIIAGISINELLAHPWVIWTCLGLSFAGVAVAAALTFANHHHAKSSDLVQVIP